MNAKIPDIAGEKEWGKYNMKGLKVAGVDISHDSLDIKVAQGVQLRLVEVHADIGQFKWGFAKTKGFPKIQDAGKVRAASLFAQMAQCYHATAEIGCIVAPRPPRKSETYPSSSILNWEPMRWGTSQSTILPLWSRLGRCCVTLQTERTNGCTTSCSRSLPPRSRRRSRQKCRPLSTRRCMRCKAK